MVLTAEVEGGAATLAGGYFRIQGAPGAPSVNAPADGSEVPTFQPVLAVNNAADPNALDASSRTTIPGRTLFMA